MFGRYVRAALIWAGAALLDMLLNTIGTELLAIADCSIPSVETQICTYGQYTIDYFLFAVTISLLVYLLFRAWVENQATGL